MCLARGADAIVAGIGDGAGVTVANLPCVTTTGKKFIAYGGIFEQVFIALRGNEFRKCVVGHALARFRLLDPRRVRFLESLDVNLTASLVRQRSFGFPRIIFESRLQ